MYQYLKKLAFTGGNVASECRHVQKTRKTKRCGGAFSLLLPLVFVTAMLLHTSVARAVDVFAIRRAATTFCQLSTTHSEDNFKLPELGGSYFFPNSNFGSYSSVQKYCNKINYSKSSAIQHRK